MTTPEKKQDGTIELDVGQIDLLDLPLPPRSGPAIDAGHESKGPPPLPPLPPGETSAEPKPEGAEPSALAAPAASPEKVPSLPPPPAPAPRPAVSARKLVDGGAPEGGSSVAKFLLGVGGASVVCVGLFLFIHAMHKAPPPKAAPSAAPTQAFTMAPIEFTEPVDSASASASPQASAPPQASAAPHASSAPLAPHATTGPATAHPATTKPAGRSGRPDDVLKVEN